MAIGAKQSDEGQIWVNSIVSGRTFEPLVELVWGEKKCQLGLDEARDHAMNILEAVEAAQSDAFVFQWLMKDVIGTEQDDRENFAMVIEEFKKFREERGRLQEKK